MRRRHSKAHPPGEKFLISMAKEMKTPKGVYLEKQLTMIFSTESGQGDGNTWRSESQGVSHLVYFPREDHP